MNQVPVFSLCDLVAEALSPHARRLLVLVEVALEGERLAAPSAVVRLLRRVRLDVRAQVGLVGETLATLGTRKRLLPCVGADVTLQEPGAAEPLPTVRTLASLVVRSHVHAVGGHGYVNLVAVGTLARLLVVHAAVSLSVPRQVARRAVPLAALHAHVGVDPVRAARRAQQQLLQRSPGVHLGDVMVASVALLECVLRCLFGRVAACVFPRAVCHQLVQQRDPVEGPAIPGVLQFRL